MKKFFIITLTAMTLVSFHSTHQICEGFLPENDWQIEELSLLANDMTEAEFNATVDGVAAIYREEIEALGFDFIVEKLWSSSKVNGEAREENGKKMISIFGGIGRQKRMNRDSLAIVVCHEVAHHLGGEPRMSRLSWSSVEGQADFVSTLECTRRLWQDEDNVKVVAKMTDLPDFIFQNCEADFTTKNDQALCVRTAAAGMRIALMIYDMKRKGGGNPLPRFDKPDLSEIGETKEGHPKSQCRLDTYIAGSRDLNRPRCWFKPENI